METEKIGIVTVLYKSETVLDDFFKTLNEQDYKNFILYIIDNKSPDNSLYKSKELASHVWFKTKFIENNENYGVAKGNNQGIEAAIKDNCDYVLLSNNDVILQADTIKKLYLGLKEMNATLAVPKIYFFGTNKIWAAGGIWNYLRGTTVHLGLLEEDCGQWDKSTVTSYAPTCFMLISASVFDRVGIMDELYFIYYDDTDFVWRATKEHTEKLVYIHKSKLWHKESISMGGYGSDLCIYYTCRNSIYFVQKHFTIFYRLIVYGFLIIHYFFRKTITMTASKRAIVYKAYKDAIRMCCELK